MKTSEFISKHPLKTLFLGYVLAGLLSMVLMLVQFPFVWSVECKTEIDCSLMSNTDEHTFDVVMRNVDWINFTVYSALLIIGFFMFFRRFPVSKTKALLFLIPSIAFWSTGWWFLLEESSKFGQHRVPMEIAFTKSAAAKAVLQTAEKEQEILAAEKAKERRAPTTLIDGLEVKRCFLGQMINDEGDCIGDADKFTFDEAQIAAAKLNENGFDGKKDWRVPTARELAMFRSCYAGFYEHKIDLNDGAPLVEKQCFDLPPDAPWYIKTAGNIAGWIVGGVRKMANVVAWSSSNYPGQTHVAWYVDFDSGSIMKGEKNSRYHVLLVRTSQ